MATITQRLSVHAYSLMRFVTGLLILWHGSQKLFGFPAKPPPVDVPLDAPPEVPWHIIYVAGPIELVGGILVMIGLFTRPAAFLCSELMAFAYWIGHGLGKSPFPVLNHGELAALYCFVFLFISAQGGGKWSIDAARPRRRG